MKLAKGNLSTISNLYEVLTTEQVNSIKALKMLTFSNSNKNTFKMNDKIKLELKIKNVKSIQVKTYAIDMEKMFIENNGNID